MRIGLDGTQLAGELVRSSQQRVRQPLIRSAMFAREITSPDGRTATRALGRRAAGDDVKRDDRRAQRGGRIRRDVIASMHRRQAPAAAAALP